MYLNVRRLDGRQVKMIWYILQGFGPIIQD